MDFKFVYIIGFFFVGLKSKGLFTDTDAYPLSDYGNVEPSNAGASDAPKESAWDKMMKLKEKYQPTADQFSGLKDKLPKDWGSLIGKKKDEENFGLGNLYGEEETPAPSNSVFNGLGDKFKGFGDKFSGLGDKFNQAKDTVKNANWPKPWHEDLTPESPSNPEDEPFGLDNLYGEGETPEKKSWLDKLDPKGKLDQAKDAWNSWGKKNHDPESPLSDPEHGAVNPEQKSPLHWFDPTNNLNKAKDAFKNSKWFGGDEESPSNSEHEPFGLGNLFGEGDENPEKKSFLDKFNPKEKFNQGLDAIKSWNKPKHDPESPESPSNYEEEPFGLGNLFGEDDETPEKKSLLDRLNARGKFDQAKDALSKLDPKGKFDQAKDALGKLDPKGKFDQAKDALSKLDPKGKFDQTKEAVKNMKFPWWPKKNQDGESPGEGDVEYDNDEPSDVNKADNYKGDPYINGLDADDKPFEDAIGSEHWPIHGLHPSEDSEHPGHESEKKPHHPESLGELLEEEFKELEEEAKHPEKASHYWPDFNWSDEKDKKPESENHHPGKHHKKEEEPHHKNEDTPDHKNEDTPHHKNFPDWSWNHHNDQEPHHKSPEKKHKKHEKEDVSDSEPLFPDWFGKSDEQHAPKSGDEESDEHHGKNEHPTGSFEPEIPSWLWPDTKDPEPEHHKNHPQPLQETFYDVRGIGDGKTEKAHGKDGSDDDGSEDEDDDDGSDDDEDKDGNKTDSYDTDDDNEIGREKDEDKEDLDPDEADILKDLNEKNKSKPKRDSDDEADDDSSDSDDDDDDDDDDENGAIFDDVEKDFSIWKFVLPMVAKNLPSIPNPFSVLNRVTVSFASINDLQRDPEYLHKSIIKKVNQKYHEKNEETVPGTTISLWPPHITRG